MYEWLSFILALATTGYLISKNRSALRKHSIPQLILLSATFLFLTISAGLLIFYGANWVARQMPYDWISTVVFTILVIFVMTGTMAVFHKVIDRVSKENEDHPEMKIPDDPMNQKLCALLNEGKDVKAVRLARETFGLSLIEGRQYVDALKSQWKEEEYEKSQ